MILKLTLKSPDAISEFFEESVEQFRPSDMNDEDWEQYNREDAKLKLIQSLQKWIKWQEYVYIEFDTEKGTATVLPAN